MTGTHALVFLLSLISPFLLGTVSSKVRDWLRVANLHRGPSLMIILAMAAVFFTTQTSTGEDAALPGPMRMTRIGILFLLAGWAAGRLLFQPGRLQHAGQGALWLVLYAVLAMLSTLYSPIPVLTLWKGFEVLVVVLVAISLTDLLRTTDGLKWLVGIVSITVMFFVFDLLYSVLLARGEAFANFEVSSGRMAFAAHGIAPNLHPNSATQMGAFLVAITTATLLNAPERRGHWSLWLLIAFGIGAMILGHSRTSLFSCTLAIIMIMLYGGHIRLAIGLGTLGLLGVIVTSVESFIAEFVMRGQDIEGFASMSGRTEFWAAAWEGTKDSIWLGKGYYAGQRMLFGASTVDNTYLEVFLNLGVVGITIFILPIVITMAHLFFSRPDRRTLPEAKFIWLVLAAIFIIVFIRSLSGPTFQVLHHNLVLYSLLVVAAPTLRRMQAPSLADTRSDDSGPAESVPGRILRRKRSARSAETGEARP